MRYTWFNSPMIYKASPIFDYAHPIIIKAIMKFPKFVSACKKISSFHQFILEKADFRVSRLKRPHQFLTTTTHKLLKQLLTFLNFYQHTKNQFIQFIPSWDTAIFGILRPEWPHPFLTTPTPIFFGQLLISMNLYQHAKIRLFHHLVLEIELF